MTFAKIKSKHTYTTPDVLVRYYQEGKFTNYELMNIGIEPPLGWKNVRVHYHINKSHPRWQSLNGDYSQNLIQSRFGTDLEAGSIRDQIQNYDGATPLTGPGLTLPYLNFETPLYFSAKEANEFNGAAVRPPYAEISPHYNFFHDEYEKSTQAHPETIAPNMYIVLDVAEKASENKLQELTEAYVEHATAGGSVETGALLSTSQLVGNASSADNDLFFDPLSDNSVGDNDFISGFGQAVENTAVNNQAAYLKLISSGINMVFAYQDSKKIDDFNRKKNMFPMDISIKFSRSESTKFANMFKETSLEETFIKDFIAVSVSENQPTLQVKESITTISQTSAGITGASGYETITEEAPERDIEFVDIDEMISGIFESEQIEGEIDQSIIVLGDQDPVTLTGANKLYKTLLMLAFRSKYSSAINEKQPSFKDVLENKKAYSETLVYKVSKFNTDEVGESIGQPIQNYYFFNNDEDDAIEFVDTQVKYNKSYNYKIYAYDMTIGLEYYYDSFDDGPLGIDKQLEFLDGASAAFPQRIFLDVVWRPRARLVETLIYEASARIMSKPPLPPEITMVPYRNVSDKMLILMNNTTGKRKMQPVQIEQDDIERIQLLRDSQNLISDQPIVYAGDDIPFAYEIFRIDKKPETYEDFKDNRLQTVLGNQAASFLQTGLKTNRKYYYTFRTIDIHNMFSNPTPIYELEIVENSGVVYPIIKVVDPIQQENKTLIKNMKKYIYIRPSDGQSFVNLEQSNLTDSDTAMGKTIVLGVEDESVWNKRFKFRFTSRDTGKKIDLNVKFKQKNLQK